MLIDALNRTLLLMGTALNPTCTPETRLQALTATRVVIQAETAALRTASGQSALVTAATLMARSGHEVWIDAEETMVLGPQPPLRGSALLGGLMALGRDLLPDCEIRRGAPQGRVDLAVLIGARPWVGDADQIIAMNAGDGWTTLASEPTPWAGDQNPLGGMAAGAMAASEAFKSAMRRLRDHAPSPAHFDADFAPAEPCKIALAADGPGYQGQLPQTDLVSGGAIGNAVAFVLLRMPGLKGALGVLDNDRSDLTNLNRNALLRRSNAGQLKVDDLAVQATGPIGLQPRPVRFELGVPLASMVLIGVDDIPSRWAAQATGPEWMAVGATAGFSVQVSEHRPAEPCAGCLHPMAATAAGPIPTVAFVSFWAGLLLVTRWLRHLGGQADAAQQTFFSPLRPEGWEYSGLGVAANPTCPVACAASAGLRRTG
jgi:hypothetical protein